MTRLRRSGHAAASRRIVFVSTGLGRGGAETQLVRIAVGLACRGWQPEIVSLMDRNLFGDDLAAAGIPFHSLGIPKGRPDPRGATRLLAIVRRSRPQVVCSFLTAANTVAPPVARLAGVPVVVASIRNLVPSRRRTEWVLRATAPWSDAVVFNSPAVASDTVGRGLVAAPAARVIRNGLDLAPFGPAAARRSATRQALGLADDAFAWISVAHLRSEKNYPTLIRAFRRLHAEYPRVRLLAAGGFFADHEPARAAAGDLLESGVVRLLGNRDDVPDLLAAADAFVLASLHEASPNALIEALASRLPSVATAVGGVRETIVDATMGVVVATPTEDDLLEGMRRVMAVSPDARRAMGEAGRRHVAETYGIERLVDEWEALFVELLGSARAGGVP